jgi:hypothetical protein
MLPPLGILVPPDAENGGGGTGLTASFPVLLKKLKYDAKDC